MEARVQTLSERIPYVGIQRQQAVVKAELLEAVGNVIEQGQFILGEALREFEDRFAQLCGVRFAVGVNSGTDALLLALRVLNIGSGDEVISVPNTFISTISSIQLIGARPVLVDVRDDYNMDPSEIQKMITARTRAILPVHLTGRPADMDPINTVARENGLAIVEDAAQAVLARYAGKRVGSFGALGCFSLHPLKTLGACGDAGVITTNNEDYYEQLLLLRNLGLRTRDSCAVWSAHSRLDNLQAAILLVKLKYVEEWTRARQAIAAFYREHLNGVSGVKVPRDRTHEQAVYHTFVIQAERRDALKSFLVDEGIQTAVHYAVPVHLQEVAEPLGYGRGSFPKAEEQAERILSLPIYPELRQEEMERVVETIKEFYKA